MVWPLYLASSVLVATQMLAGEGTANSNRTSNNKDGTVSTSDRSSFLSGIVAGIGMGYIIAMEIQRHDLWERCIHWLLESPNEEETHQTLAHGLQLQTLTASGSRRSPLIVEVLTIPPNVQLTTRETIGTTSILRQRARGAECWYYLSGSRCLSITQEPQKHARVKQQQQHQEVSTDDAFLQESRILELSSSSSYKIWNQSSLLPAVVLRTTTSTSSMASRQAFTISLCKPQSVLSQGLDLIVRSCSTNINED